MYLRGEVADEVGLQLASFSITMKAKLATGEELDPRTYTIPLSTTSFGDHAHLAIRNATGAYVGSLSAGRNDVVADFAIPGVFLRTGTWTFHVEAALPDGRCLFSFQTSQWLKGRINS